MDDRLSAAGRTSVVKGIPLSEEPGLGALTLPGFLREVTEKFFRPRSAGPTYLGGRRPLELRRVMGARG